MFLLYPILLLLFIPSPSHYKRLQRFFRDYEMDYAEIAQAIVTLMAIPEPWVLSIDRTDWQFGDCVFNSSGRFYKSTKSN